MKVLVLSSLYRTTPVDGAGSIENFVHLLSNTLLSKYSCEIMVLRKSGSKGGNYSSIPTDFDTFKVDTLKAIDDFKPDLIHLHFDDIALSRELSKLNVPVLYTIHSYSEPSQWLEIVKEADKNVTFSLVSESLKENLFQTLEERNIHYFKDKFVTTGIGIDVNYYISHNQKQTLEYFLYLGLIRKHKAVLELVKAFSKTSEKLVVAGPLKDIPYCNEVIRAIDNYPYISYYGEVKSDDEKIQLLSKAKTLILATGFSKSEPDCKEAFGLVMVEANAVGIPILGYAQGNMTSYIVNGKNGYLFKTEEELLSVIKTNSFSDMSKFCVERALPFDIKPISENYYNLYEKVILND